MKWEYKIHFHHKSSITQDEAELNRLGEEGWELVEVCKSNYGGARLYFKRPSQSYADHIALIESRSRRD